MLRSGLKKAVAAIRASRDKGQLPQDARLWGHTVRRFSMLASPVVTGQLGKAKDAVRARKVRGWRKLAEEGREALEDAARIARREAEQMEAFTIFEKLEGTYHGHRAQAVVLLKYLELEAEKLVCQLPRHRREELREVAVQLRDASLAQSHHTRDDGNCGQCTRKLAPELKGGDCCSGMVFMAWDELDALYRVLIGEFAPLIRSWSGDFTRCGFLVGERCSLAPGSRPVVCQAYYCTDYREALEKDGRWAVLGQLLDELQQARAQLGFRVKMVRRFGLGEVHHSDKDHPVDFLWERMRSRGARYAASSADATKETITPRLKIMP